MTKHFFLTIFFSFHLLFIYGGGYRCHRFKVIIRTETDSTIIGFVQLGDNFRDYDDSELFKYLKENYKYPYDTLKIYDTIFSLNYPKMKDYQLTAILNKDITKIAVNDINNINVISKSPCQEWLSKKDSTIYDYYYAWVGHTMLISELSNEEINLLEKEPNLIKRYPLSDLGGYYVISYSDKISEKQIDVIINQFKDLRLNYSGNKPKHLYFKEEYIKMKNNLREEKIIIFRIDSTA